MLCLFSSVALDPADHFLLETLLLPFLGVTLTWFFSYCLCQPLSDFFIEIFFWSIFIY